MASAGLLKLLYSGFQDERLLPSKGILKLKDFQKVYVKGGRFTSEWYSVKFDNTPAFGQVAKCTIPRRGHLITRAFLMLTLPDIRTAQVAAQAEATKLGKTFAGPRFGWTNSVGHALINSAQVTIGANVVDTLDGRLMEVLDEFHTPLEKVPVLNRMIGRHDSGFSPTSNGSLTQYQELAVPLPFWFARGDPSEALPIDAIGTDILQISLALNPLQNLITSSQHITSPGSTDDTYPNILGSPFYVLDPAGTPLPGLNGIMSQSVTVSPLTTKMPASLQIQSAYILLEYIYLDGPEANRLRLGDLSYPIVQHYATVFDTGVSPNVRIPMRIPNPCRELYFYAHRKSADLLNAPFLATRDLSGLEPSIAAPWWPDATGLSSRTPQSLVPAYSTIDSQPLTGISLTYEGRLVRYATDIPAIFQSVLPSFEQRKTPWHNKYYYHIPFGTQNEQFGISNPMGHANLDKFKNIDLSLTFSPTRGSTRFTDVPSYNIYLWAETYNILRVYGGRAGLLFAY